MSRQVVGQLVDRWLNDPEFRKQVRQDPEGAIQASGLVLSPEEWTAVRSLDWKLSDEELKTRANNVG